MKNFSGKLIYGDAPTEQAEIEGLKRYGWSDVEVASMTPAQRRREFQEAMEIDDLLREQAANQAATAPGPRRPEGGGEVPPEAGTSTPPGPEPSLTGRPPTEHTEIDSLKRHGWSDHLQDAIEIKQSEPTAELAPWRENPSKPVEGAARTRSLHDIQCGF